MKMCVILILLGIFVPCCCFSQDTLRALPRMRFLAGTVQTFTQPAPQTDKNVRIIPENFYENGLGFFCRQEIKMQQVHVPLVFRVGSMDDCNYLEQKPGYTAPVTK